MSSPEIVLPPTFLYRQHIADYRRDDVDTAAADDVDTATVTAAAAVVVAATLPTSQMISPHLRDTESACALLRLLQGAVVVGNDVDTERGHVLPAAHLVRPGELRGTGWAKQMAALVLCLQEEIHGPQIGRE